MWKDHKAEVSKHRVGMGFASWNHRKLCVDISFKAECLLPPMLVARNFARLRVCVDSLDKNAFKLLDSNCIPMEINWDQLR